VPKAPPTPSPKAPGKVASDAPAPAAASDRASGSRGSRPELEVSVEEVDSVELQSVPPSVDDGWGEPEPEGAEPPKKAPPPVPKKPAGAKASLPPPARAATGAPQAAKGRSHRPGTKPGAIKPVIPKPVVTPPADKKTKG
jgi:hypothetical protein